jgi:hypothetical protein
MDSIRGTKRILSAAGAVLSCHHVPLVNVAPGRWQHVTLPLASTASSPNSTTWDKHLSGNYPEIIKIFAVFFPPKDDSSRSSVSTAWQLHLQLEGLPHLVKRTACPPLCCLCLAGSKSAAEVVRGPRQADTGRPSAADGISVLGSSVQENMSISSTR